MQTSLSLQDFSSVPDYCIELGFFSGPLDLLLHLVHQQEVAIEDVEMSLIADQYLELISKARLLDLDRATEYLVIAATLIAIKSENVLPCSSHGDEGLEDGFQDSQFYEELRERLKQYELTKNRAEALREKPQLGINTFTRIDRKAIEVSEDLPFVEHDRGVLATMFVSLLKRIGETAHALRIALEPVTVVGQMMAIVDRMTTGVPTSFFKLMSLVGSGPFNRQKCRSLVIGSFVATLELAKRGFVSVEQRSENLIDVTLHIERDDVARVNADIGGAPVLADNVIPMDRYRNVEGETSADPIALEANKY